MRTRVYLKIAKTSQYGNKFKVHASTKSSEDPINVKNYKGTTHYPTVGFAVDFNIPDELFSRAQQVIAEIDVTARGAKVLAQIPVPEKDIKNK